MKLCKIEYPNSTANNLSFALEQHLTIRMASFSIWKVRTNKEHNMLEIRYRAKDNESISHLKNLLTELNEKFDFDSPNINNCLMDVIEITNIQIKEQASA